MPFCVIRSYPSTSAFARFMMNSVLRFMKPRDLTHAASSALSERDSARESGHRMIISDNTRSATEREDLFKRMHVTSNQNG